MKRKIQFMAMLLIGILLSVNQSWATEYSCTLASGDFGTASRVASSITKNAVTWDLGFTWKNSSNIYLGWDASKGVQVGKGTNGWGGTVVTFTTSGISGTITKVTANASTASSGSGNISVTVNGGNFKYNSNNTASLSSSAANYEFSGSASGTIVVTFTNTANAKAMYIKSITVTYTSGGSTYTVDYSTRKNAALYVKHRIWKFWKNWKNWKNAPRHR